MNIVEICCGSYYDAKMSCIGNADRIELNSALHLGGLTPSLGSLIKVKKEFNIKTICMIRSRGGGFFYNNEDIEVMFYDAKILLENGADGLAFGFLNEDKSIDLENTKKMVDLIKSFGEKEAVFHRAFDCVSNPYKAVESLIDLKVDRILTSGLKNKAIDGIDLLKDLNNLYNSNIEFVVGSGVNYENAKNIIECTGINQVHSSCKQFLEDKTTIGNEVSYSFIEDTLKYDVVSLDLVKKLVSSVKKPY